MLIKNNPTYDLKHRAYFIEGRDSMILAISQNGQISILNLKNKNISSINLKRKIRHFSFSSSAKLISIVDDETGELVITDFDGTIVLIKKSSNLPYGYISCYFDLDNKHLWCSESLNGLEIKIQLYRIEDWKVIDKVVLKDSFSCSYFLFYSMNEPASISLLVAAGQDGQEIWWLKNSNGKIKYQLEMQLINTTPPIFSPNKSEFLVLYEHEAFHQYQYPKVQKIGEYKLEFDNENDIHGYSICYLDNTFALVNSDYGLIFLLNTKEKKVVEQIIIENHEPLPINKFYPELYNDKGLATDISLFERFGNNVVFASRENTLIIIPVEKILESIS